MTRPDNTHGETAPPAVPELCPDSAHEDSPPLTKASAPITSEPPPLKALYDFPTVTPELAPALQRLKRAAPYTAELPPSRTKLEADRQAALAMVDVLHRLLETNAHTYYAMQRAHEADTTALAATRNELDHWREARQFALEAGEVLKSERDTALEAGEVLKSERDAALLEIARIRGSQPNRIFRVSPPGIGGTYIASRVSHAATWRRLRDTDGWKITSSWIDEASAGKSADLGILWSRIEAEIERSERLILYVETEDFPLKGALIEVGMAIATRIPVRIVAPGVVLDPVSFRPLGSWVRHPLVTFYDTMDEALEGASVNM